MSNSIDLNESTSRKSFYKMSEFFKPSPSTRFSKFDNESNIKILATLVPDEIIYGDKDDKVKQSFDGVLLFVDISGFTDLCEKYNQMTKGGPSRITQVLNSYMGAMVQEIMTHNGDIQKFSGDAFMALWKTNNELSIIDVVHAAIDCALGIQRSHGTYTTEVGIILRVKIALAAGLIFFSVIGDSNFMILGNTMLEVKELGNLCNPGDIIISSSCRTFIGQNEYVIENIPLTANAKVLSIGSEWTPSYLNNQYELFDIFSNEFGNKEESIRIDDESRSRLSLVILGDEKEQPFSYFLRPSVDYAVTNYLEHYLRKFIIPPVIKAIDLNEPLDYLTEMRHVVIVFINIVSQTRRINNLIQLCNETYDIIQEVQKIGGCLNKISMFDKDLMFLVIFGLRGFKHTLDAQRALYCAKNMRDSLAEVKYVENASIGVCTGKTYCGVVGHPLRKEYTVIGRTVNKAARLMCAYPNMVSCDSQTYLESRLQARYFTLQPAHYLKGFKNVGPIYKFDDAVGEEKVIENELIKTQQYPLLACQKEMELFFNILMYNVYSSDTSLLFRSLPYLNIPGDYHMFIVRGKERQGKTRFLKEVVYFVGDTMSIYKCNISYVYAKELEKYRIFRCLFGTPCKLTNETNLDKRTQNVLQLVQPFKATEFLCALNDILQVNFEETKYYLRLTDTQQHFVQMKIIKYLCIKAFGKKCILTVDNIEYIDEESWSLLHAVLNTGLVILCVTMGFYATVGNEALSVLDRSDVTTTVLQPVHKVYHVGLICQFMNVMGVSLHLERYIQIHSNGNPGWIESFLTTLINSEGIKIVSISKEKALSKGYVLSPYVMIYREVEETLASSSINFIDIKEGSFVKKFEADIEGWDLYSQAIQDIDDTMYKKIPDEITVCDITENFNLEEMETEDLMDVSMLRNYDSLKVHEQQLLKCSAILGDCFTRNMLEYVTQSQNARENAVAIKKLFEIRIFSCGRAKFVNGAIQVKHHLTDPNASNSVKCYCVGFPINVYTKDLPKYANCGYILFRKPLFRQMLFNLLTENQANLYHVRCVWFLESETRRCLSCDLGYFANLIGETNYDGMRTSLNIANNRGSSAINLNQYTGGIHSANRNFNKSTLQTYYNSSNPALSSAIEAMQQVTFSRSMTSVDRTILKDISTANIRTFFDNNLIDCECETILKTMYTQMIKHCQEAELYVKLMHSLLAYATISIRVQNITVAITLLENATELLETKLKFIYSNPCWDVPLTKGRIMTLYGQLHLERRAFKEAERCLLESLRCYKIDFPKYKLTTKIRTKECELKQFIIVELFPHRYIGTINENTCLFADQTSEALSTLYTLYMNMMIYDKAYLASLWGMNEALKSNSNFYVMCVAFTNLITLDIIYTRPDISDKLEQMALKLCHKRYTRLEKHELDIVVRLYGAIFCRKFFCVNLSESLKMATIVKKLNSPEFGVKNIWPMMPLLLQSFIYAYWTAQAALLVEQSSFYCNTHDNCLGPLLYYILCIEFKLYTTYTIVPIEECVSHVIYFSSKILPTIEMRYLVAVWLWYVKKGYWQSASFYHIHVSNVVKYPFVQEPTMIYVILHLIEGYLILYVRYINTNDVKNVKDTENIYKRLIKRFKKIADRLIGVKARFLLLQAYWQIIHKREDEASKLLEKALTAARDCNMYYEIDWIEHTKSHWFRTKPLHRTLDSWQAATDNESLKIDWNTADSSQIPIPFYTYPLPIH